MVSMHKHKAKEDPNELYFSYILFRKMSQFVSLLNFCPCDLSFIPISLLQEF